MEKAYDLKALVAKLKARGLDLAEDGAIIVIEEAFAWLEESAPLSATPYDDMALVVFPPLKKMILEAADGIDGKIG